MVGVPNRGASKAWNPLPRQLGRRSRVPDGAVEDHRSRRPEGAARPCDCRYGLRHEPRLLQAPQCLDAPEMCFVDECVPTARALLATYDFIDFGLGVANVTRSRRCATACGLNLNDGLDGDIVLGEANAFADQAAVSVDLRQQRWRRSGPRHGSARPDLRLLRVQSDRPFRGLRRPRRPPGECLLCGRGRAGQRRRHRAARVLDRGTAVRSTVGPAALRNGRQHRGTVGRTDLMSNVDVQRQSSRRWRSRSTVRLTSSVRALPGVTRGRGISGCLNDIRLEVWTHIVTLGRHGTGR